MFIGRKTQYCPDVSYSHLDLQIPCNPNQNSSKLFGGLYRGKRTRTGNITLKENNKVGGQTPL